MRSLTRRRVANASLLLLALTGIALWLRAGHRNLGTTSFTTGYLLLAAVLLLASYNVRKKLPFLPLGNSATWLQWHLYIGLGSVGVFAMHVGPSWPQGILDALLAGVYLLTTASGLLGLYWTRTIPRQLARVGEETIYERIPALRAEVRRRADAAILESVGACGATTLADFYLARLYDFFSRPRGWSYVLRPTAARRRALLREMADLRRYLSEEERSGSERLFALVRRKDELDFHEARQGTLRLWLFVHIGLTWVLVGLVLLHGLLAHAFQGGGA
jgi:hypothetical protein